MCIVDVVPEALLIWEGVIMNITNAVMDKCRIWHRQPLFVSTSRRAGDVAKGAGDDTTRMQ